MSRRRQTPLPLMPNPPQWALDAGLPEPEPEETFKDYVVRLGYDYHELVEGLSDRTMVLAHERLVHKLVNSLPAAWEQHLNLFIRKYTHGKDRPAL